MLFNNKQFILVCNIIMLLFISLQFGCSPKTSYQTLDNTAIASYFSVQDQVNLVNAIAEKFTNNTVIEESVGNNRPTLLVDTIQNSTSEHINTESITDTLKASILASGKFKIINRKNLNLLAQESTLNSMGLTNSNKAIQLGKLYGANYVLYGNFSSIVNYVANSKNTFYKLTMFLQNIETGEEVWGGEASVNKVTK